MEEEEEIEERGQREQQGQREHAEIGYSVVGIRYSVELGKWTVQTSTFLGHKPGRFSRDVRVEQPARFRAEGYKAGNQ